MGDDQPKNADVDAPWHHGPIGWGIFILCIAIAVTLLSSVANMF